MGSQCAAPHRLAAVATDHHLAAVATVITAWLRWLQLSSSPVVAHQWQEAPQKSEHGLFVLHSFLDAEKG